MKPSSLYAPLKFVYFTSQLYHSIVVHNLITKYLIHPCKQVWLVCLFSPLRFAHLELTLSHTIIISHEVGKIEVYWPGEVLTVTLVHHPNLNLFVCYCTSLKTALTCNKQKLACQGHSISTSISNKHRSRKMLTIRRFINKRCYLTAPCCLCMLCICLCTSETQPSMNGQRLDFHEKTFKLAPTAH